MVELYGNKPETAPRAYSGIPWQNIIDAGIVDHREILGRFIADFQHTISEGDGFYCWADYHSIKS